MPISRGMMERQLRMGGGIMNIVPREEAFLGGLKKAIKGVAKGIGSFVKSDFGKAALLGAGAFGLAGMGPLAGLQNTKLASTLFGMAGPGTGGAKAGGIFSNLFNKISGMSLGKKLGLGIGIKAADDLGIFEGMNEQEIEEFKKDPEKLRNYLNLYFTNLNPDATQEEINELVERNMFSSGGRMGFQRGGRRGDYGQASYTESPSFSRPDDSGPSTPPPSVLARKPKVNIPTPDRSDDRGILSTVGDYFSNLPNPLFTPAAAENFNIEEEIKKLEQRGKDQRKKLTIADDTVAKGIGSGANVGPVQLTPDKLEEIADEADLPGSFGKANLATKEFIKRVQKGKYGNPDLDQKPLDSKSIIDKMKELDKKSGTELFDDFDEDDVIRTMPLVRLFDNTITTAAEGGRIGYARGDSAEDNAMQAAGVMGLPLNQNPAGITELDLRETGGFIPPVGVKEKADDIPAMLSNNEFVFTADAVRGMGDGDVNKGAQRMYDMMKRLENGGRV